MTRLITRPDAVLHGEEAGAGPTALFLHAGGERRRVWAPVIDVLVDAGFRCVAFDQRGHGESGGMATELGAFADDVAAMLRAEPPGCVVVGASLGGLAAIAALADPRVQAAIAGLVLVDVIPDLEPLRVRRFLSTLRPPIDHTPLVEDILTRVPQLCRLLADLNRPVLLVHGDSRSAINADDIDRLLRLAPHAVITRIPSAGHLLAREEPTQLAQAIAIITDEWPALALLRDLGAEGIDAGDIENLGGSLLDHLRRVSELVAEWGGSRRARLAALCHAAYGTDGSPSQLLAPGQRTRLRAAIGDEAETLVYRYGACDRRKTFAHLGMTPLPLTDRFTGETILLTGSDLTEFALLALAEECVLARTTGLAPERARDIRALIDALKTYVPEAAARALAELQLS